MFKRLFILLLCIPARFLAAQQPAVLNWHAFRTLVLLNHPLSRQADLYREQSKAGLLRAEGAFDPKVYVDYSGKKFNEKTYFQYTEAGVKWPTWLGLELKGNYNLASGNFLNPEAKLPSAGQVAAGLNWTLGQGLFIDERRAGLLQSRIGLRQAEAERSAALNNLLYDAAKVYWEWALAQNQLRIFEEALDQARNRYEGLLESYRQGDKPAIDTLEAFIQVQNRSLDVQLARVDLQNAALEMANFVWTADGLAVPPDALPLPESLAAGMVANFEPATADSLLMAMATQHPALRLYGLKLQELDIERRLKKEKRKPVLDLQYQLLGNGWQFFPTANAGGVGVLGNDIKWGIQFSYPILNRKARGDWQVTQVKIAQLDFSLQQKRQEVEIKVRQYLNEVNALASQVATFRDITANYRILLEAENEKFRFGESSVFLINTREQRWLEAQVKYLKLLSAYRKAEASLLWAAGTLAE